MRTAAILAAMLLTGSACSVALGEDGITAGPTTTVDGTVGSDRPSGGGVTDDQGGPGTTVGTVPGPDDREPAVQDPAVQELLSRHQGWTVPVAASTDDRELVPAQWTEGKRRTSCEVTPVRTISRTFDELAAFPFGQRLLPGLIVEGAGLVDPDVRPLTLGRAPLRLNSSLDSANSTVEVADPTPSNLKGAVTALKRDADARLTGIDVVPADITYQRKEVHSYEEAMLDLGLSLNYDSDVLRTKFESAFRQEERKEKHSIAVQLVQPMFTLWVDRSDFRRPADHFATAVAGTEVQALIDAGRIGADNPPVLIDSVTYGRIMYFTMTSTDVESSSELELAVEAAWGNIDGSAQLTERQRQLLSQSDTRVLAYGGDQSVAEAALYSGNLSEFFTSVNTTTAAPLSLQARTLDGTAIKVADEATVRALSCGSTQEAYTFEVRVRDLASAGASIFLNDRLITTTSASTRNFLLDPTVLAAGGEHEVKVEYWAKPFPWPCLSSSLTVDIVRDGQVDTGLSQDWGSGVCAGELTWVITPATGAIRVT